MAKKAIFCRFGQKWPFLATFSENRPVATGPKSGQNPENGVFLQKGLKIPGPGHPAGAAFTSTPRGGALSRVFAGVCSRPGRGSEKRLLGALWAPGPAPGPGGTFRPRDGDRAPPRGVDVKPPSRRRPSGSPRPRRSGNPPPGAGEPSRAREPGIPGSRDLGPRTPPGLRYPGYSRSRAHAPRRPAPQGLFYINPSRRGPVAPPGPQSSDVAS